MKYEVWYIIDEDENRIVDTFLGTKAEAEKKLEEMKEARDPMYSDYWDVWSLFRRVA